MESRSAITLTLILVIVLAGACLRFYNLDERTWTHPEFYVAGLDIPAYITHPTARHSVADVMAAPFRIHHPHLPGHDVLMLGWTSLFGTGATAIRTSSALAGVLLLVAAFLVTRATADSSDSRSALLASAILAFHGHQIYWSQLAKQWILLGLAGVVSAWLLLLLMRRWCTPTAVCYTLVCVTGLWIDSYFWPVFAAQILFVYFGNAGRERLSGVAGLQTIALMGAGCAIPYLLHFSGQPSHLSAELWPPLLQILQFGALVIPDSLVRPPVAVGVLAGLLGAVLMIAGIGNGDHGADITESRTVHRGLRVAIIAATMLAPFASGWLFLNEGMIYSRRWFVLGMGLPVLLACAWFTIDRYWPWFARQARCLLAFAPLRATVNDLPSILLLVPLALLVLIHLRKPVLAPYALAALAPFGVIIASRGLFRLGRIARISAATVIALLVLMSLYQLQHIPDPRSSKALASALLPQIRRDDVLLIEDTWYLAPLTYYFSHTDYTIRPMAAIGPDRQAHAEADAGSHHDRFWLIELTDSPEGERRLGEKKTKLPDGFVESAVVRGGKFTAVLFATRRPYYVLPDLRSYAPAEWRG